MGWRIFALTGGAAWITLAGAAYAQGNPSNTSDIVVKGERPEDKKICTTQVATGSIVPKRVCKTQAQITLEREKSLAALEQIRQDREVADQVRLQCEVMKCGR